MTREDVRRVMRTSQRLTVRDATGFSIKYFYVAANEELPISVDQSAVYQFDRELGEVGSQTGTHS